MNAFKWAVAIPAAVLWLASWPFALLHDACSKALGLDEI